MWKTTPRFENPGFAEVSLDVLATVMSVDRGQTVQLYRLAYEQALAVHGPSVVERLAPSLN
jgi:hypothetical protein